MIIQPNASPIDLRSGIWRHYKGGLYQVVGYSHNASESDRTEILYLSLGVDPEQPGPRWCTREWREFFETVCTVHQGRNAYSQEHEEMVRDERITTDEVLCVPERDWVERFVYLGPLYLKGFETERSRVEQRVAHPPAHARHRP